MIACSREWLSNGFWMPVRALRSSKSCKHHAMSGTSKSLLVIVAQQSTKLSVTDPELPAVICRFLAYASAMAADVTSDAGHVSRSLFMSLLISWMRWNIVRCTAAFTVENHSRCCNAYQYRSVALGRTWNLPVALKTCFRQARMTASHSLLVMSLEMANTTAPVISSGDTRSNAPLCVRGLKSGPDVAM